MPALEEIAQKELDRLASASLIRILHETTRGDHATARQQGKPLISFSCNDYLGLSQHPKVKEAATNAIATYGSGAGASRLVTGNHPLYSELETKLATYKGTEAALVFGSGYLTNSGIIPALVGKGDLILADKFVHACLIDGTMLSGARLLRFPHNHMEKCKALLEEHRAAYRHCLILTDTIFSMDGDKAPLETLSTLAKEHDSWLLTDDAHVIASDSKPIADLHMGTLSKALGSYGGYVCGSRIVIDYLKNTARSLIFTTGLPPSVIASAIAALDIMTHDAELANTPLVKARYFTSLLEMEPAQSQIVPLIIGEADAALTASATLMEKGFLVLAIRPPTVPQGTARLRLAFSALHQDEDIARLAGILKTMQLTAPSTRHP